MAKTTKSSKEKPLSRLPRKNRRTFTNNIQKNHENFSTGDFEITRLNGEIFFFFLYYKNRSERRTDVRLRYGRSAESAKFSKTTAERAFGRPRGWGGGLLGLGEGRSARIFQKTGRPIIRCARCIPLSQSSRTVAFLRNPSPICYRSGEHRAGSDQRALNLINFRSKRLRPD